MSAQTQTAARSLAGHLQGKTKSQHFIGAGVRMREGVVQSVGANTCVCYIDGDVLTPVTVRWVGAPPVANQLVLLLEQGGGLYVLGAPSLNNANPTAGYPTGGGGGTSSLVPTTVKTTNYTAAASDFVTVDTTSGAVTITLPTAPTDKTQIGVKMVVQGGSNNVTIAAGGSDVFDVAGGSATMSLSAVDQTVILQYMLSAHLWYVISAVGAGGGGGGGMTLSAANAVTALTSLTQNGAPSFGLTRKTGAATAEGVDLGSLQFTGYYSSSAVNPALGDVRARSTELFSATAGGTELRAFTTPKTTIQPYEGLRVTDDQAIVAGGTVVSNGNTLPMANEMLAKVRFASLSYTSGSPNITAQGTTVLTQNDVGRIITYANANYISDFPLDTRIISVAANGLSGVASRNAAITRPGYASSPVTGITTSGLGTTNLFNKTAHGLQNGNPLAFTDPLNGGFHPTSHTTSGGQNLSDLTPLYVVNATANTFQVASTPGGAALTLGGTAETGATATVQLTVMIGGFGNALKTNDPQNWKLRSGGGSYVAHYSFVPSGSATGDPSQATAEMHKVYHDFDDVVNSVNDGGVIGPRGMYQYEGQVFFGPNFTPQVDVAAGPWMNMAINYQNRYGSDSHPGGIIYGVVLSPSIRTISNNSFTLASLNGYWSNAVVSDAGGPIEVSQWIAYQTADFITQASSTALLHKYTGYRVQPVQAQGGATLRRFIGIDIGAGASGRTVSSITTTAGSAVVTAPAATFTAADLGAFVKVSSTQGDQFIKSVDGTTGSQVTLDSPVAVTHAAGSGTMFIAGWIPQSDDTATEANIGFRNAMSTVYPMLAQTITAGSIVGSTGYATKYFLQTAADCTLGNPCISTTKAQGGQEIELYNFGPGTITFTNNNGIRLPSSAPLKQVAGTWTRWIFLNFLAGGGGNKWALIGTGAGASGTTGFDLNNVNAAMTTPPSSGTLGLLLTAPSVTLTTGGKFGGLGHHVQYAPTATWAMDGVIGFSTYSLIDNRGIYQNGPSNKPTFEPAATVYDAPTYRANTMNASPGVVGSYHAAVDTLPTVDSVLGGAFSTGWDIFGLRSHLAIGVAAGVVNRYGIGRMYETTTPAVTTTPNDTGTAGTVGDPNGVGNIQIVGAGTGEFAGSLGIGAYVMDSGGILPVATVASASGALSSMVGAGTITFSASAYVTAMPASGAIMLKKTSSNALAYVVYTGKSGNQITGCTWKSTDIASWTPGAGDLASYTTITATSGGFATATTNAASSGLSRTIASCSISGAHVQAPSAGAFSSADVGAYISDTGGLIPSSTTLVNSGLGTPYTNPTPGTHANDSATMSQSATGSTASTTLTINQAAQAATFYVMAATTVGAVGTLTNEYGTYVENLGVGSGRNIGHYVDDGNTTFPITYTTQAADSSFWALWTKAQVATGPLHPYMTGVNASIFHGDNTQANIYLSREPVTGGAAVALASGNGIGTLGFRSYDGAAFRVSASIQAFNDANAAAWSSGVAPTRLEFSTMTTNALVRNMALDSVGGLHVGAVGVDGTTKLVNASHFAVDNNGKVWFSPSAYSGGQPSTNGAVTIGTTGNISIVDGGALVLGTSTGTKIGSATTQKIGFWNATPVAVVTGWGTPTNTFLRTTFDTTTVSLANLAARVGALINDLLSYGILHS